MRTRWLVRRLCETGPWQPGDVVASLADGLTRGEVPESVHAHKVASFRSGWQAIELNDAHLSLDGPQIFECHVSSAWSSSSLGSPERVSEAPFSRMACHRLEDTMVPRFHLWEFIHQLRRYMSGRALPRWPMVIICCVHRGRVGALKVCSGPSQPPGPFDNRCT